MKAKILFGTAALVGLVTAAWWLQSGRSLPPAPVATPGGPAATPTTVSVPAVAPTTPLPTSGVPAGSKLNLAEVPEIVRGIVDPAQNLLPRLRAVHALPGDLQAAELQPLFQFLRSRQPEDEGQPGHEFKNDLMDALVEQYTPAAELAGLLTDIYRDPDQNTVLRDYAIQHLSLLSERLGEVAGVADLARKRQAIQEVIWQAAQQPEASIAGTALLALTRLSETDPGVDRKELGALALRVAGLATAHEAAQITALQVCARLQVKEALPLLVTTAETGATPTIRISAIGALGLMGGPPETPVLQKISASGNARFAPVAVTALRRITERSGQF